MTPVSRPVVQRLAALVLLLGIVAVPLGGALGVGPLAGFAAPSDPVASAAPTPGLAGPGASTGGPSSSGLAASPAPTPLPTLASSPTPTPLSPVALVPVTQFRATATTTDASEIGAVLAGTSKRYGALELVSADADAVLSAVGATRPADPARLVLAPDARALRADLAAHRDRVAIIRAGEVDPSVRALAWGGVALFGVGRVESITAWPLTARLQPASGAGAASVYDPGQAWTLFAGGDILLDRGVALTIKSPGKGVDFPFGGGSAAITSRYCCSSFGWRLPRTSRTADGGAMRALVGRADLAIANFENPAPARFTWHEHGTVFNANPAYIAGLANAGIDWVSLANNHIRDAGATGILQTITALERYKVAHGGAGAGYAAAHAPTLLTARGVRVAMLGYDTIAASYWARSATTVGSAQMTEAAVKADVTAARSAGAEVVVVFPHWGAEYTTRVSSQQTRLGRAAIDAGADLVIGNHAHWAGAVEIYKGKPIWYALGNFVFDQTWSEPTMEGITLELTFKRAQLVQAVMRPHIILDKAQPNFMDPSGSGKVVMDQVLNGSKGLLPW